jgi:predicted nucleic acid-binding protein
MRIDAAVVNASPLISLFRSGQASLLPRLFDRIVVPEAVWQEVGDGLEKLRNAGLWLSDDLVRLLKRQAAE